MKRLTLILVMINLFTSCETPILLDASSTEKIVYNFHDSSVPPEYHRSYEISINKNSVGIIVDSYGDTLNAKCVELKAGQFDEFIEQVNAAELTHYKHKNDLACSGSTSESLKIYTDKLLLNTYLDHCQVDEFPAKSGDVRTVINELKAFFPDLDELLK